MTKVTYTLNDGSTVNSLAQAQASGQHFHVSYETIEEKPNLWFPKAGDRRIKL